MQGKITLITPPDIFENSNTSVLFSHITDEEQDTISKWLSTSDFNEDINFYVYSGEPNVSWFLYAMNRCEYKYINIDCVNYITQALSGYILGRNGTYYRTDNSDLAEVYSHINNSRVDSIEQFLESILSDQTTNESLL